MDASTASAASAPPSVQMQLASLDNRLRRLEEAMNNFFITSLDLLEIRVATQERMIVTMGTEIARQARDTPAVEGQDRARPY